MKITTTLATAVFIATTSSVSADVVVDRTISEDQVLMAQKAWCDALINISKTHTMQGQAAASELAEKVIDSAYGYQLGVVLFKPTLTVNPQTFRTTREGALSYFVGGNPAYPDDDGFALNGWTKCEIDNSAILIIGNSASTMGKVHLTDKNGNVTSVDKSWKFVKDDNGQLRIVLHHSSLEFTGE
ncbi:MAG: hypothetical protein AB4057_04730 [Crocosphaera sp.]